VSETIAAQVKDDDEGGEEEEMKEDEDDEGVVARDQPFPLIEFGARHLRIQISTKSP